ncbi:hypothetical protein O3885_05310 [Fusobacterium sp. 27098_8_59]|jgi:hypothetical protein|uniref:hypothetical protein n=1 Tax=Fusobacterium sp. 27098_8_59 TaxID=3003691 RepID=UPI00352FC611
MIKRMIILIVMGLTLSSCDFIHYGKIAIQDNVRRIEMEREKKSVMKKDGPAAIDVDEYKEGVEEAIKDILKRPINKKVEFKGTTLIIPEGTRINPKHGNIVDEKTGYGIPLIFQITKGCSPVYYRKKIKEDMYCKIYHNGKNYEVNIISKKIINTNGFTNTCK